MSRHPTFNYSLPAGLAVLGDVRYMRDFQNSISQNQSHLKVPQKLSKYNRKFPNNLQKK